MGIEIDVSEGALEAVFFSTLSRNDSLADVILLYLYRLRFTITLRLA